MWELNFYTQGLSVNVTRSTETLSHWKPPPAGRFNESSDDHDSDKRNTLYNLEGYQCPEGQLNLILILSDEL